MISLQALFIFEFRELDILLKQNNSIFNDSVCFVISLLLHKHDSTVVCITIQIRQKKLLVKKKILQIFVNRIRIDLIENKILNCTRIHLILHRKSNVSI